MVDTKKDVRPVRQRKYLNKDFNSLRSDLIQYVRTYYPDRIQDFSENSLGGVFVDLNAYVGDVMSFYLDHQFGELFTDTAVETANIEKLIRSAGVEITGNSPAVVDLPITLEIPATKVGTTYVPEPSLLPIIREGTTAAANNGTRFELTEDIDYSATDSDGNLDAEIRLGSVDSDGTPLSFLVRKSGLAISGFTRTETFVIGNDFVPFRRLTLSSEDVTEIISVTDSEGNKYYEVSALSDDTVFRATTNRRSDSDVVDNLLEILPAPYRYVKETDISTRLTTLVMGGGTAESLDNDIIPDPSQFAIPLYGKTTFERFSINPNEMLQTRTLGVAPTNTTLNIVYRFGGGLSHNVSSNTIRTLTTLLMVFPEIPSPALAAQVRASADVNNIEPASGGENAPTINELKSKVPAARNAQKRIASREDVLARVYTMPSNFGRVFRAGMRSNPNNPLASQLFIVSRNSDRTLTTSPDTLKENLITYLNSFRMLSDATDILDAPIVNIGLDFEVVTDAEVNKSLVVSNVISKLRRFFNVENFQIDQPIKKSDIDNIIYNTDGVLSVTEVRFRSFSGTQNGRVYSGNSFNIGTNFVRGLLFPPPGGIFEVKYPDFDIRGSGL